MTTVVFLPGTNHDALAWKPVIDAMPPGFDCVALDLPAEPKLDRLIGQLAEQIPEGSLVVGHSLGGAMAMHLTERHPDRVSGLVLVNAYGGGPSTPEMVANRITRAEKARDGAFEEMAMENLGRLYHGARADDPAIRAERLRGVRGYGVERYYAHAFATSEPVDRSEFLRTLDIPVLVLAASNDLTTPTAIQREWASANGVPYVEIPETGHSLPLEEPTLVAKAIAEWWEGANDDRG